MSIPFQAMDSNFWQSYRGSAHLPHRNFRAKNTASWQLFESVRLRSLLLILAADSRPRVLASDRSMRHRSVPDAYAHGYS